MDQPLNFLLQGLWIDLQLCQASKQPNKQKQKVDEISLKNKKELRVINTQIV
jgi:hypothetical protein